MTAKKALNPEYKDLEKAIASQKTIVAKAAAQHSAKQSSLFSLCKEKEKAEIALNKITDKVEDSYSVISDSEALLDGTRGNLKELAAILKETPKYIQD